MEEERRRDRQTLALVGADCSIFSGFAASLPEAEACTKSIAAITDGRTLLADPDPVPELTKQLATALRTALGKLQGDLSTAFTTGITDLLRHKCGAA